MQARINEWNVERQRALEDSAFNDKNNKLLFVKRHAGRSGGKDVYLKYFFDGRLREELVLAEPVVEPSEEERSLQEARRAKEECYEQQEQERLEQANKALCKRLHRPDPTAAGELLGTAEERQAEKQRRSQLDERRDERIRAKAAERLKKEAQWLDGVRWRQSDSKTWRRKEAQALDNMFGRKASIVAYIEQQKAAARKSGGVVKG